jgi:hypothetical protein
MALGCIETAIVLMGWYLIIAALTFRERNRRANVLPLTLGPHSNNFDDIVDALRILRPFVVVLERKLTR